MSYVMKVQYDTTKEPSSCLILIIYSLKLKLAVDQTQEMETWKEAE